MKGTDWVYFACHGNQDTTNPTNGGLCLADECRLKASDIITLSRSRGGLTFLSACETATGDKHLSGGVIHIAAGILFVGYGGVVGTMWSISDRLAPNVTRSVYDELFRDDKRPDYRDVARVLYEAIKSTRDRASPSLVVFHSSMWVFECPAAKYTIYTLSDRTLVCNIVSHTECPV